MDSSYYFDTRSLRDHVSDLREEFRVAQRLHETVKRVRDTGDPLLWQEYGRVLNRIGELQHYFERMIDVLDNAAFDAAKLSQELGKTIQDGTDKIQDLNNKMMI